MSIIDIEAIGSPKAYELSCPRHRSMIIITAVDGSTRSDATMHNGPIRPGTIALNGSMRSSAMVHSGLTRLNVTTYSGLMRLGATPHSGLMRPSTCCTRSLS